MQRKKVAILGAGMAGLSFAYYLKKYNSNVDFVILEKSTRELVVLFFLKSLMSLFLSGVQEVLDLRVEVK